MARPTFLYYVPPLEDQAARDTVFQQMVAEGTLATSLSVFANPTIEDWQRITHPTASWMLRCEEQESGELLGVGLFTPWRWRVWEFDFVAMRKAFPLAVDMAKGAFDWIFAHAPIDSIVGICPAYNRHAWRLAEACGFTVMGRIPGACFWARRQKHVDGIMVMIARGEGIIHKRVP